MQKRKRGIWLCFWVKNASGRQSNPISAFTLSPILKAFTSNLRSNSTLIFFLPKNNDSFVYKKNQKKKKKIIKITIFFFKKNNREEAFQFSGSGEWGGGGDFRFGQLHSERGKVSDTGDDELPSCAQEEADTRRCELLLEAEADVFRLAWYRPLFLLGASWRSLRVLGLDLTSDCFCIFAMFLKLAIWIIRRRCFSLLLTCYLIHEISRL